MKKYVCDVCGWIYVLLLANIVTFFFNQTSFNYFFA